MCRIDGVGSIVGFDHSNLLCALDCYIAICVVMFIHVSLSLLWTQNRNVCIIKSLLWTQNHNVCINLNGSLCSKVHTLHKIHWNTTIFFF